MNFILFKLFEIDGSHTFTAIMALIFALATTIVTSSLSVPSLINIIKNKKVSSDTKYYSLWIFYAALAGWTLFGGFQGLIAPLISNIIAVFSNSVYLYFVHKYSNLKKKNRMALGVLITTLLFDTFITSLALSAAILKWQIPNALRLIFAQIVPMLSTFAFLPQILKDFETKNFKAMSLGMVWVFVINNILWICYFIFIGLNKNEMEILISPLVWQTLSLFIYSSQLSMMLIYRKKGKNV
ncbi:hypothetical protein MCSF7_02918 [Mycoplasmopsis columbina SF7]|uniref:PQ loop repeat family protein n=1 Tax=Mycoplasmopsis columbina SF7 TaxID=1037410 RepID=F9UJC5_9BACT|nr:PQ-loop domain-containing transporter [Mycoplasmopsis columbina]EGV00468.1 hypothetical protein MCSF7_02918 [Mycoplasmopsis columbina SF7]